jgi:hypothetical protein
MHRDRDDVRDSGRRRCCGSRHDRDTQHRGHSNHGGDLRRQSAPPPQPFPPYTTMRPLTPDTHCPAPVRRSIRRSIEAGIDIPNGPSLHLHGLTPSLCWELGKGLDKYTLMHFRGMANRHRRPRKVNKRSNLWPRTAEHSVETPTSRTRGARLPMARGPGEDLACARMTLTTGESARPVAPGQRAAEFRRRTTRAAQGRRARDLPRLSMRQFQPGLPPAYVGGCSVHLSTVLLTPGTLTLRHGQPRCQRPARCAAFGLFAPTSERTP